MASVLTELQGLARACSSGVVTGVTKRGPSSKKPDSSRSVLVTVRIEHAMLASLKAEAERAQMGYQTLLKLLVAEGLASRQRASGGQERALEGQAEQAEQPSSRTEIVRAPAPPDLDLRLVGLR